MSWQDHMPSRDRMLEMIKNEPDLPCEAGLPLETLDLLRYAFQKEREHIDLIERGVRARVIAEVQRALRLYPEWCAVWGLDRNMNVATEAANECADMLDSLPLDLPEDDDAAAMLIARAISRHKAAE